MSEFRRRIMMFVRPVTSSVPSPTISPAAGAILSSQNISISISGTATSAEYSFDNQNWTTYTSPFTIASDSVVYARAMDSDGNYSGVVSNSYTILPYDAEIEYLESTGSQYINTGIYPTADYTFDCKVATTTASYNCVAWGTRSGGSYISSNLQCYFNANSNSGTGEFHLYSTNTNSNNNWSAGFVPTQYTMYEYTGITVVSTMTDMTYPVILFGLNVIGSITTSAGKCRIGGWTAYNNGVKVADMIPVRVGSVGYMYDKVSGELFGNLGSGSFTYGNDV